MPFLFPVNCYYILRKFGRNWGSFQHNQPRDLIHGFPKCGLDFLLMCHLTSDYQFCWGHWWTCWVRRDDKEGVACIVCALLSAYVISQCKKFGIFFWDSFIWWCVCVYIYTSNYSRHGPVCHSAFPWNPNATLISNSYGRSRRWPINGNISVDMALAIEKYFQNSE